ncbi:hypothetical protein [Sphingobium sp. 15-1]|uniref:hypothetical protein n=1 Tax=Sphingobium sp. 15-1 TaxID=2729616 RepID=UPI00159C672D|nr:hypothetical protein [Sphingobium sp. 15-1]
MKNSNGGSVNIKHQMLCAWSGVLAMVLFVLALWPLASFIPPLSPTMTPAEVATFYQEHTNGIRIAAVIILMVAGLNGAFAAVISVQMKRIEKVNPALTYTQMINGCVGSVIFIIPAMVWTITAFRPDRPVEITYVLNDMAWLFFIMPFGQLVVQCLSIGLAILSDTAAIPVFPRWIGFFNFWIALLVLPAGVVTFFKTGPFAWSGIVSFWVPAIVFGIWFIVMFVALRKAIMQQSE